MLASKASMATLLRLQQKARARLRRICLLGLEPAAVRALGQLLGRHFYLLVAKDKSELLSVITSPDQLDAVVVSAAVSGIDTADLVRMVRSAETPDCGRANVPIFVFAPSNDGLSGDDLENLGVRGFFRKPGDIWKLAEAIHGVVTPVEGDDETAVFGTGSESVVVEAIKHIEENLVTIKNSTDVSGHLGVTREHLSRQFTRFTGQTLWDFVTTCRVYRARDLLKDRDLLVKQICREVGFNCESSFFRAFTRKTGFTPEGFRKTLGD